jgi:hypothetical protein
VTAAKHMIELRQRQKIYRLPRPFVDENGMIAFAQYDLL